MKDISFWQDKLNKVKNEIHQNTVEIRFLKDFGARYHRVKIKKLFPLNRFVFETEYYSKYLKARERYIRLRNERLTKIGKLQRENKRLRETKLAFYQKKIAELTNE